MHAKAQITTPAGLPDLHLARSAASLPASANGRVCYEAAAEGASQAGLGCGSLQTPSAGPLPVPVYPAKQPPARLDHTFKDKANS